MNTETDRDATIADFRHAGVIFGISCADAARRLVAEGKSAQQVNKHVRAMIAIKDVTLRQIDASTAGLSAFFDAAGETAARSVIIAELFGGLNRRQRRAMKRPPMREILPLSACRSRRHTTGAIGPDPWHPAARHWR